MSQQTLNARSCVHWGALRTPRLGGTWARNPVTSPTTYQHNRVFHLPTLSEASTNYKDEADGWGSRERESLPPQAQVRSRPG